MQARSLRSVVSSRRQVLLLTVGLLLLLDLGRSLYARLGYAQPLDFWQPDPKVYADLTWPPGTNLPASTAPGQQIYAQRCASCHGPDGRGNGPAAPSMIPRPRDFTAGQFKYKSTPPSQPPSDADLAHTVANGLVASAMPYFHDILSDADIRAVVAYIKGMSVVFGGVSPTPITVPPRLTPDAASIARGQALFTTQGCAGCHGADARGGTPLRDAKGYPVIARDLTAPWTFRGGSEPEQIWLRLTTGLAPGPMPSYADKLTPAERWDVVNYILSLARTPPWEPGGTLDGPGHRTAPVVRGQYLVHAEMCGLCHTQINASGIYRGDDAYLAGGMGIPLYPQGVFVSRNLTSDPETGLGNWTVEQIADAIRNGRAPDRVLNFWGMPWMFLHSFTPQDALAIASYLKTLPPVRNRIPPTLHYGVAETIIAKLAASTSFPPLGTVTKLVYMDGNFGESAPGLLPRDLLQRVLVGMQWLVLLVGIVAFVRATPPQRRLPRHLGGWVRATLSLLGVLIVVGLGWVLYSTPALGFIPPEQVNTAITSSIPKPDPARFRDAEQAALAERGRYLYTVASCAFCHNNSGSGGATVSWRASGTLWARNITSDRETGIGEWSDAEIARALRSGVSRSGRQLHWQGMIWDHLSNLDEEDVRALIAYLRTLPAVRKVIPPARPPAADDCEEYTFLLATADEVLPPGCR
jgi:mono/diheme cytochrome c family protein